MTINKEKNGKELTVSVEGRLDTVTAPELEKELKAELDSVDAVTLDFGRLEYISSAGLRVLLSMHKVLARRGGLKITGANEIVREVFDVTGFSDILNIA